MPVVSPKSRNTRQKQAIVKALQQSSRALSMEEILAAGREHYESLSERTVFRQLRDMMDVRELVRVYLPGQPARYELPTGRHCPHFICRRCNQVYVLPDETPEIIPTYPCPPGFSLEGEEIIFYGTCADCKPGDKAPAPQPL